MSNQIVVLTHQLHPLYQELKELSLLIIDIDQEEIRITPDSRIIFDCTLLEMHEKEELLRNINQDQLTIISDTSCLNGGKLLEKRLIHGAFALSFQSPKKSCEYFTTDDDLALEVRNFLKALSLEGVRVNSPGIGFTYPRVITQIINEAYFALEEELATAEAIDTAMQFGVNYPLGPLAWAKTIGFLPIVQLLDELLNETGDERYACSQKLRAEL